MTDKACNQVAGDHGAASGVTISPELPWLLGSGE